MTANAMPSPGRLRVLWGDDRVGLASRIGDVIDVDGGDTAARIDGLYRTPGRPWVRMNMLGTLNARVIGPDGTSDTVSNRADRAILERIRAMSDAIVVGARTLRQERHTSTGSTPLVVVTRSGDLSGHRIGVDDARAGVTVLCPPEAQAAVLRTMPGARIEHPVDVAGRVSPAAIVDWCDAIGHRSIVVEGGGDLIGQFLDADLLDEACLTQAPVFGPSDAAALPGSTAGTRFVRVLLAADDLGYVYSRLVAEDRLDPAASRSDDEN